MFRPYASIIKPGSIYEGYALRAARTIVLRFYRLNGPILKKKMRSARPRISYTALRRMTVKQLNMFISKHLSDWRKLSKNFQQHYTAYLNKDRYDRFRISLTTSLRNNLLTRGQAGFVWRTVFPLRQRATGALQKKPAASLTTQTRPANKRVLLQRALVSIVRKVYGASKSESYVKTVLKTQSWRTLKGLGIASATMNAFARLGYRSAARSEKAAQALLKKTLKNWKKSSGATVSARTPPAPQPRVQPRRPSVALKRPVPRSAKKQAELLRAIVAAVRKAYGASKSESYVKSVLKTQSWTTLKQLGIAADIQNAFGKLGYAKAARSAHHVQKLLKKILKHWK